MWKERPYLPIIILFALIGLACNAFAGDVEPGFEPPPPLIPDEQVENDPTMSPRWHPRLRCRVTPPLMKQKTGKASRASPRWWT
jgi:hypothetical protein